MNKEFIKMFSSVTNRALIITLIGMNVGFFIGKIGGDKYMEITGTIVAFFFIKKGYEYPTAPKDQSPTA